VNRIKSRLTESPHDDSMVPQLHNCRIVQTEPQLKQLEYS